MGDLFELLARVRQATGQDTEIDYLIAERLFPEIASPLTRRLDGGWQHPHHGRIRAPQCYSDSVDACIDFAERALPGHNRLIGKGRTRPDEPLYGAQILDCLEPIGEGESDHSEALAFLSAILSALIARDSLPKVAAHG